VDRPGALDRLRRTVAGFAAAELSGTRSWCVALSGGPDSLALTAAAAGVLPTTALIVDHGLQPGSADVAEAARERAEALGCRRARVLRVEVGVAGGPEAAARAARYAALEAGRDGAPVLLGHTLDDQAETVLLGLGRGSGPRSIAGMRPCDPPWYRPLLTQRRALCGQACAELGLLPWDDPHNSDRRFTRVRLRLEVLPLEGLEVAAVAGLPAALRRRVLRGWLLGGGATGLTDGQIRAVDSLVTGWRGQGGVAVGSSAAGMRLFAERRGSALSLRWEPV